MIRMAAICIFILCSLSVAAHAEVQIDLQWSICKGTPAVVLQSLGQGNASPDKLQSINYFDSLPVSFAQQGISFRTKEKSDSTLSSVKVRFSDDSYSPKNADCSWDQYGSKQTYTCEIAETIEDSDSLWSDRQTKMVEEQTKVDWKHLNRFGPFENPKWSIKLNGLKATFDTVEADQLHLMELSIKVDKSEGDEIYASISQYLSSKGVGLCEVQEGKTLRLFKAMGLVKQAP